MYQDQQSKHYRIGQKLLAVAIFCTTLCTMESTCSAQISDVFQSAFKAVSGFNVWMAWPSYTSSGNSAVNTQDFGLKSQKVFAYSIKFAPIVFGAKYHDSAKDIHVTINSTYTRVGVSDFYQVRYDTVRTDSGGKVKSTHSYCIVTECEHGASVPPTAAASCQVEEAMFPTHQLSLNLGYSFAPSFDYQDNSGFSTSFPVSSIFLQCVTQLVPWEKSADDALSLVFGASIPTLSNIRALSIPTAGDTTRLKFNSSVSFSPDLGLGYSHKFGDFYFFADLAYQWQVFRGLDYSPALPGGTISAQTLDRLPKEINAGNLRLKFGFSFNVAS